MTLVDNTVSWGKFKMTIGDGLARLGYGPKDRVVVIHADDVGMCQATLPAMADLFDFGLVSSAAVMVPCSSFLDVAAFCRAHPQADVGVHLTLTSEWRSFPWGPISQTDPSSGLVDPEEHFWPQSAVMQENANCQAAQVEMQAQVDRALAVGIDVTHIDSHMGSVFHPKLIRSYAKLAIDKRIPLAISRHSAIRHVLRRTLAVALHIGLMMPHRTPEERQAMSTRLEMIRASNDVLRLLHQVRTPLLDHTVALPLDQPRARIELAKQFADRLKPGLTHWTIHPAADTLELRAITRDWPSRVADYRAFCSPALRDYIRNAGIHVVGYRTLRDIMRSGYRH